MYTLELMMSEETIHLLNDSEPLLNTKQTQVKTK